MIKKVSRPILELDEQYQVEIHFCELKGRRWAYLFGRSTTAFDFMTNCRCPLNDDYGLIIHSGTPLKKEVTEAIAQQIRQVIADE
ncbi:MAG: hypothetical protein EOL87_02510 [Spartobacteria bacterium]|nr:hypothetical protein [Spartobacteria bacterium]